MAQYTADAAECSSEDEEESQDDGSMGSLQDFIDDAEIADVGSADGVHSEDDKDVEAAAVEAVAAVQNTCLRCTSGKKKFAHTVDCTNRKRSAKRKQPNHTPGTGTKTPKISKQNTAAKPEHQKRRKRQKSSTAKTRVDSDNECDEKAEFVDDNMDMYAEQNVHRPLLGIPRIALGLHPVASHLPNFIGFAHTPVPYAFLRGGAWDSSKNAAKFLEDSNKQLNIALRFGRPLFDTGSMRSLPSDIKSERYGSSITCRDETALVLNTIIRTHRQTKLDMPTAECERMWVANYNQDCIADGLLHDRPGGGMCGLHKVTLWKMNTDQSMNGVSMDQDDDIVRLATFIAQASHSNDVGRNMIFSCSTLFSEFKKNRSYHESGRYNDQIPECDSTLEPCIGVTSKTLDPHLLHRVAVERGRRKNIQVPDMGAVASGPNGLDHEFIIPQCRSVSRILGNTTSLASPLKDARKIDGNYDGSANDATQFISTLYNVHTNSSFVQGIDKEGAPRKIRIDCIIIQMRLPGSDGCILLDCMAKHMPEVVPCLQNVLSHMALMLELPHNLNMDRLFHDKGNSDINIASLTDSGQMLPALFMLCKRRGIFNVQWQGMRMDAEDEDEMNLYREHIQHVIQSRRQHLQIIRQGIAAEKEPRFDMLRPQKHRSNYGRLLELQDGYHYVYCRLDHMEAVISNRRQKALDENNPEEAALIVKQWHDFKSKALIFPSNVEARNLVAPGEEQHIFWRQRGMLPMNAGVFMTVNTANVARYDREQLRQRKLNPQIDEARFWQKLTPMYKMAPLAKLYIRNKLETSVDQYSIFFRENGPIADLDWLRRNQLGLPLIKELVESIDREVDQAHFACNMLSNKSANDVLCFFGGVQHNMLHNINSTFAVQNVWETANAVQTLLTFHVREALGMMEASELKQVHHAAILIGPDLSQQAECNAELWINDRAHFISYAYTCLEDSDFTRRQFLNDDNLVALWRAYHEAHVEHGLTFCNQTLLGAIRDACVAHFMFQAKQWLGAIFLVDAGWTEVMAKTGNFGNQIVRTQCTWKRPGAGADSCWHYHGQEAQAYARHVPMLAGSRKFAGEKRGWMDQTIGKISPLMLTTVLGSGLPVFGNGEIDMRNTAYQTDCFKLFAITEANKQDGEDKKMVGAMEQGMSESGTGDGVEKRDWVTSSSLQERGARKLRNLGNVLLTGNRQLEIGKAFNQRFQRIASSKMDGDTGVFERRVLSSNEIVRINDQQILNLGLFAYDEQLQIVDLGLSVKGERITRSAVAWFFSVFFVRKPLVMLTNLLNISPRYEMHVTCMSWHVLKQSWILITNSLRRSYLAGVDTAERFADGACNSSGIAPNWLRTITINSITRNTSLVRVERDGRKTLPLPRIIEETVASLIYTPITLTCMLNSLYHVTMASSLDVSTMALCCYLLRSMEWYEHCPLNVLALASRGARLNAHQKQQYDRFAARLLNLVDSGQQSKDCAAWLLHEGQIDLAAKKDACQWARFSSSTLTDQQRAQILGHYEARTMPTKKNTRTHFVRSLQQYIVWETPASFEEKQNRTNYEAGRLQSAEIIASELWGEQQSQSSHDIRMQQRQIGVRFSAPELWNTICAGTGLQLGGDANHENTQDRFFPAFDSPHEQGFFYREIMSRVGSASDLMENMLQMFGLPITCSRLQLVQSILKPYLQERSLAPRYWKNRYWEGTLIKPSNDPTNDDKKTKGPDADYCHFRWGLLPYVQCDNQHGSGLKEIKGIETFLGMSIEMLIISQALYTRDWWHNDKNHWQSPRLSHAPHFANVHLRLMAYASEAIMSMLVHNHIELAALPVMASNQGQKCIRLYASSADTFASNGNRVINANVPFDQRLHRNAQQDATVQHLDLISRLNSKISRREMLGIRPRSGDREMRLDARVHGLQALWETQQTIFVGESKAFVTEAGLGIAVSDIFFMPPESVYHMHTQFGIMRRAVSTLLKQSCKIQDDILEECDAAINSNVGHLNCNVSLSFLNVLHASIAIFGQSVNVSMLRFIPLNLTELVVEQEIPCVTWRGGYMFIMKVDEFGNVTLLPVHPTHNVWLECPYSYNMFVRQNLISNKQRESGEQIALLEYWRALPLTKKKCHFPANINMQLFTIYGLTQCGDSSEDIRVDLNVSNYERDVDKKIPFTPFPVTFFPALLWLELKHELVHGDDGESYAVLIRQDYFEQLQRSNAFRDQQFSRSYLIKNKDICLPAGHELHIAPGPKYTSLEYICNDFNAYDENEGKNVDEQIFGRNFFFAVVQTLSNKRKHYHFYNNRAELKAAYLPQGTHNFVPNLHEQYKDQVLKNTKHTAYCCDVLTVHNIYISSNADSKDNAVICLFEYDDAAYWENMRNLSRIELRVQNMRQRLLVCERDLDNIMQRVERDEISRYGNDKTQARNVKESTQTMLNRYLQEQDAVSKTVESMSMDNHGQQMHIINITDMRDNAAVFAGPRTIDMVPVTETVGMIVPVEKSRNDHGAEGVKWMSNGHYTVRYLDHRGQSEEMCMDFITASACLMPEGKRCWLQIDDAMLKCLQTSLISRKIHQSFSAREQKISLSTAAMSYIQSLHESCQDVLLQVFPILGATPETRSRFPDQCVDIALLARDVHGKVHTLKLSVPLFMQPDADTDKRMPYLKQIAHEHAHVEMHVLLL